MNIDKNSIADENLDFEIGEETEIIDDEVNTDVYVDNTVNNEDKIKNIESNLYILTDRQSPNMLEYFRNNGLNVSKIFSNLQEARDFLIYQMEPSMLVIIETGLGKFTGSNARKELISTLGICDVDEGTIRIAVFYSNNSIKSDAAESIEIDYRKIKWFKYENTAQVVARILEMDIKCIQSYDYDIVEEIDENSSLKFKGYSFEYKTSKHKIGLSSITKDIVEEGLSNEKYEDLKEFIPEY